MWENLTNSIVFIFLLSTLIASIFLVISRKIGAKGKETSDKLAPYACGEDIPAKLLMVNVEEFFIYALYFMIFDILAFVLATTIVRPTNYLLPIIYSVISLFSILMLFSLKGK